MCNNNPSNCIFTVPIQNTDKSITINEQHINIAKFHVSKALRFKLFTFYSRLV